MIPPPYFRGVKNRYVTKEPVRLRVAGPALAILTVMLSGCTSVLPQYTEEQSCEVWRSGHEHAADQSSGMIPDDDVETLLQMYATFADELDVLAVRSPDHLADLYLVEASALRAVSRKTMWSDSYSLILDWEAARNDIARYCDHPDF